MAKRVTIHPKKAANRDSPIQMTINTIQYDRFNELKQEYGFGADAEAARYFLTIGMKSIVANDPRNNTNKSQIDQDETPPMIRDYVPEGEENAINLYDELPEKIRNHVIDIVQKDPEIKRNGNEVYR